MDTCDGFNDCVDNSDEGEFCNGIILQEFFKKNMFLPF